MLLEYDRAQRDQGETTAEQHRSVTLDIGYKKRDEVVGAAWDIVDWLDRLRCLLRVLAGVKRDAWYRLFMRALAPVEEVRNFAQHFDREIAGLVKGTFPVFGAVIATFPVEGGCYTRAVVTQPARFMGDSTMQLYWCGQVEEVTAALDRVTFCVATYALNLSDIKSAMAAAKLALADELQRSHKMPWPK